MALLLIIIINLFYYVLRACINDVRKIKIGKNQNQNWVLIGRGSKPPDYASLFFGNRCQTKEVPRDLGQVLWDRNPGVLKSEIGPFSDFKRKSYLMDLKSAHSQESDFQESGEVDRFLKMGTHFQERSGSLENGLCVTCYSCSFLFVVCVFVFFFALIGAW